MHPNHEALKTMRMNYDCNQTAAAKSGKSSKRVPKETRAETREDLDKPGTSECSRILTFVLPEK